MKEILSCKKDAKSVVMRVNCKSLRQEYVFHKHHVVLDEQAIFKLFEIVKEKVTLTKSNFIRY